MVSTQSEWSISIVATPHQTTSSLTTPDFTSLHYDNQSLGLNGMDSLNGSCQLVHFNQSAKGTEWNRCLWKCICAAAVRNRRRLRKILYRLVVTHIISIRGICASGAAKLVSFVRREDIRHRAFYLSAGHNQGA